MLSSGRKTTNGEEGRRGLFNRPVGEERRKYVLQAYQTAWVTAGEPSTGFSFTSTRRCWPLPELHISSSGMTLTVIPFLPPNAKAGSRWETICSQVQENTRPLAIIRFHLVPSFLNLLMHFSPFIIRISHSSFFNFSTSKHARQVASHRTSIQVHKLYVGEVVQSQLYSRELHNHLYQEPVLEPIDQFQVSLSSTILLACAMIL